MGVYHHKDLCSSALAFTKAGVVLVCWLVMLCGGFTTVVDAARRPTSTDAKAKVRTEAAVFNIVDYGAVSDGKTLNTKAIQAAVDACAAVGGGQVMVPAGVFVSGSIFLKSNVEFHLSAGAVLQGSRNFDDYPLLDVAANGYHIDRWWYASLLTAAGAENIAITGTGVIDGQGDAWWTARDAGRQLQLGPQSIFLFDCARVRINGVLIQNSPTWTICPVFCRNMTITGVTIKNPWKPYHCCDGIDLVSCSNVRISNCYVDTGDDGICLKSEPDFGMLCGPGDKGDGGPDYTKPRIPCENVIIENCVVEHAHSGVGIWAEVIGGMRNVVVSNCIFDGTRTGIRINRYPYPGGYVKDVRVDNIIMRRVEFAIEVSSYHDPAALQPGPDPETTPAFSNIHFSNITVTQARVACEMHGLPKMPVRNISFSNLRIEADKGFDLSHAEDISLDNVTVTCPGPALQAKAVRNLELRRFHAPQTQADVPVIQLTDVSDAWIHGCTAVPGTGTFVGLVGDGNRDVVLDENRLAQAKQAQAPVQPASSWSSSTYAYSGSELSRTAGNINTFLPVPMAVRETITREWPKNRIAWGIDIICRLESGAHPEIVLAPGDKRRIYLITAWGVDEQLLILEDGMLLRKVTNFKWQLP